MLKKLSNSIPLIKKWPKCCCILYGLIVSSFIVYPWYHDVNPIQYMPTRCRSMNLILQADDYQSIANLLSSFFDHMTAYYFYGGLLGRFIGFSDAVDVFNFVWAISMTIVVVLMPLFIYKMFNSVICTIFAPILWYMLVRSTTFTYKDDTSYFLAWPIFLGLPLLYSTINLKDKYARLLFFLLVFLIIGISNIGRLHSGIVLLPVIIYCLWKNKGTWKNRLMPCLSVLLLSFSLLYFAFVTIIPNLFLQQYGINSGIRYFSGAWHTVYIGLGWAHDGSDSSYLTDKSAKHIIFLDECAFSFATNKNPNVELYSAEYMDILKQEWLRIAKEENSFFITSYSNKLLEGIKLTLGIHYRLVLSLIILFALIKKKDDLKLSFRLQKWYYIALVYLWAVGLVYGLIAAPFYGYLQGAFAAYNYFIFYLCLEALCHIEEILFFKIASSKNINHTL